MQKVSLSFGICVLAFCAVGETKTIAPGTEAVWASREDQVIFTVAEKQQATQSGVMCAEAGATFQKVGAGEMKAQTRSVIGTDDVKVMLREGKLSVEAGSEPVLEPPTDILNTAAIWLDATKNVVETQGADGTSHVTEWRDCRETESAVPFAYYRGCIMQAGTGGHPDGAKWPVKGVGGFGGKAAIDFQGYGAYCYLAFQSPTAAAAPTAFNLGAQFSAYDVFVVHSVTRKGDGSSGGYGFLVGATHNEYHPSSAAFNIDKRIGRTDFATPFESRWWMNGKEIDAVETIATLGDFVFDARHYGSIPMASGLYQYYDTNLPNRNGGDLVYEVLIFSNRLDGAEHAQVRRYLTDKYGKTPASTAAIKVVSAAGTSFENVTGARGVEVAGDADVTAGAWYYSPGNVFSGLFALSAGNGSLLREDLTLALPSGGTLDVSNDASCNRATLDASVPDVLEKTGVGNARVKEVPAAVTKVDVQGGVFSVAPGGIAGTVKVPGAKANATMPNPDFQLNFTVGSQKWLNGLSAGPKTANGWTADFSPDKTFDDSYAIITANKEGDSNWYITSTKTAEDAYIAFRGDVQVYTSVEVPADGRYDIEFELLHQSSPMGAFSVWIGDSLDNLVLAGGVQTLTNGTWFRRSVRTPYLTAGQKILVFRQNVHSSGPRSHYLLDNIVMSFVAETERVLAVPNGDFEYVQATESYAQNVSVANRGFGDAVPVGWTFTQPTWTNVATVGLAIRDALYGNPGQAYYFNRAMAGSDTMQLLLASTGGEAKTASFHVPAGTWRVRADVSPWRMHNLVALMKTYYNVGILQAKAKVGASDASALGTVRLPGVKAFKTVWDTPIVVPAGGADVELSFNCLDTNACGALVDNVELVAESAFGNLIVDGDFDQEFAAERWRGDVSLKEAGTPRERVAAERSGEIKPNESEHNAPSENYRDAAGGHCGLIGDCGSLHQTLTVTEPGRYRLSYYTRERYNWGGDEGIKFNYGSNRFRVMLTYGGETNVLDEVDVSSTNWMLHATMATLCRTGTCDFVIQGLNVPTKRSADRVFGSGWDKRGYVDGVSLVKVADGHAPEATPFDAANIVSVAEGAKLRLDYLGTNHVEKIRLGGRIVSGVVSAKSHPDYIIGEGALESERKGMTLIIR